MKFEIDENQIIKLRKWQESIKEVFGEYGNYDYIFTPTGIGDSVKVKSHLSNTIIDLTDVSKW
jgi:hypothetical protein